VSADRPINAEEAPTDEQVVPKEEPNPAPSSVPAPEPKPAPAPPRPPRKPKPLAPKLLALLVVLAVGFILAAIVFGSGGGKDETSAEQAAPAPSSEPSGDGEEPATAESLGFPGFATNNTTRVGGADPAANAAAVALAAFPATTESQRPKAVTLIDEGDWAGAIAAAVLMAPPVRAPVLFSSEGAVPQATEEALAALQPKNTHEVAGSGAAAAGEIAILRDRLFPKASKHIVIAPADAPEFAMPAAAWAARSGDPVLFASGDDLPPATVSYLERHNQLPIYVLGPSAAISSEILREAEKIGGDASRVSGEDPVANAIAFARYNDGSFGWNINDPGHGFVLVRDDAPLDAAAAAPLSGSGTWGPLLLTDSADTLPAELRDYFLDVKPGYTDNPTRAFYNHVWVIGDQEAIDVNQQAEVNELAELAKIGSGGE